MRRLVAMFFLVSSVLLSAQGPDEIEALMKFYGVSDPENLDPYETERLSEYFRSPLEINTATVSSMEKSGLFTPFQVASLLDYRSRHGDVFSFTELEAVAGFGKDAVCVLEPFLSLAGGGVSGREPSARKGFRQDVSIKAGYRADKEDTYIYGLKYRMEYSGISLSISGTRPYDDDDAIPDHVSGNISWNYGYGRVLAGDFNARFGQGLCLWNSAVMGGLTSPAAFMRRPSGISPTYSFTGSSAMTGVAGDVCAERWRLSAMLAVPGVKTGFRQFERLSLQPVVNLSRYGRYGHMAVTHSMEISDWTSSSFRIPRMKTSADASFCIRGVNLFGELAYDWVEYSAAGVCGTDFCVGDSFRMAALLKYYPATGFSNEYGAAVSGEWKSGKSIKVSGGAVSNVRRFMGNFSVDVSYHPESKAKDGRLSMQVKPQVSCDFMLTEHLMMKLRVAERFRTWGNSFRTDVRVEMRYMSELLHAAMRLNALDCVGTGLLGYMEGGFVGNVLTSYLRLGLFKVDDWDDRIYVYERDAPDSFNVPAYYGRGFWTAVNMSLKSSSWCRLYLRASYVGYPFMPAEKKKSGRAELKIQCVLRL